MIKQSTDSKQHYKESSHGIRLLVWFECIFLTIWSFEIEPLLFHKRKIWKVPNLLLKMKIYFEKFLFRWWWGKSKQFSQFTSGNWIQLSINIKALEYSYNLSVRFGKLFNNSLKYEKRICRIEQKMSNILRQLQFLPRNFLKIEELFFCLVFNGQTNEQKCLFYSINPENIVKVSKNLYWRKSHDFIKLVHDPNKSLTVWRICDRIQIYDRANRDVTWLEIAATVLLTSSINWLRGHQLKNDKW